MEEVRAFSRLCPVPSLNRMTCSDLVGQQYLFDLLWFECFYEGPDDCLFIAE